MVQYYISSGHRIIGYEDISETLWILPQRELPRLVSLTSPRFPEAQRVGNHSPSSTWEPCVMTFDIFDDEG